MPTFKYRKTITRTSQLCKELVSCKLQLTFIHVYELFYAKCSPLTYTTVANTMLVCEYLWNHKLEHWRITFYYARMHCTPAGWEKHLSRKSVCFSSYPRASTCPNWSCILKQCSSLTSKKHNFNWTQLLFVLRT